MTGVDADPDRDLYVASLVAIGASPQVVDAARRTTTTENFVSCENVGVRSDRYDGLEREEKEVASTSPMIDGFVLDLRGDGPFGIETGLSVESSDSLCDLCGQPEEDGKWFCVTGYSRLELKTEEFVVCSSCCSGNHERGIGE